MIIAKIIVVIMGGNSTEREISLASGNAILNSLKSSGIKSFGFDWCGDNLNNLFDKKFDSVFIALHGSGGEDGFIQQILEDKKIPYSGTNSKNSKNCLDKHKTKQICINNNLPTSDWVLLKKSEKNSIKHLNLNFPIAVKPTTQGSSIGISKVEKFQNMELAIREAFKYGEEIILESWITGKEYSVAIVQDEIFSVVEIIPNTDENTFYDYQAKYKSNTTKYECPASLSDDLTNKIKIVALKTFKALKMKDWGRIDFIKDSQDNFYILEVNTIPGMTSHSLVPMTAKKSGVSFDDLVKSIIKC